VSGGISLRVCHIIVGLGVGGAERMLGRLAAEQGKECATEILVVSLTDVGGVGEELRNRGLAVTALGWRGLSDLPRVLRHLVKVLGEFGPDVVQTWMYHADLIGGLAARISGVRGVVWGIRTMMLPANAPWSTKVARKLCASVSSFLPTAIVCNSEAAMRYHVALGYRASKMRLIPNGFDVSTFIVPHPQADQVRAFWGLSDRNRAVGMVGRDSPDKDPANFIAAMRLVLTVRENVVAVMIGRGFTADNPTVAKLVRETGQEGRFVLAGETSDVAATIGALDVFVLPSKTESFPNVVAEALAMQKPCVVTDVGDARQIVGDCGFVVAPESPAELAEGVLLALDLPPDSLARKGVSGRRRIEDLYGLHAVSRNFTQLWLEILSPRGRPENR
jgi:glycosyltransferase involved in cell wall biosynthesis